MALRGTGLMQLTRDKVESYRVQGANNSDRLLRDRDGGLGSEQRAEGLFMYTAAAQMYFRDPMASQAAAS